MSYIKGEVKYGKKKFSKKELLKIINEDIGNMNMNKMKYLYNYIQKIKEG